MRRDAAYCQANSPLYRPQEKEGQEVINPEIKSLIDAVAKQTDAIGRLVEQNQLLIAALVEGQLDQDNEGPASYMDGSTVNGQAQDSL